MAKKGKRRGARHGPVRPNRGDVVAKTMSTYVDETMTIGRASRHARVMSTYVDKNHHIRHARG